MICVAMVFTHCAARHGRPQQYVSCEWQHLSIQPSLFRGIGGTSNNRTGKIIRTFQPAVTLLYAYGCSARPILQFAVMKIINVLAELVEFRVE
jgi:hypothetical protein